MSSTTTIFGLVALTNSLFASCFYCIKSERRLADARYEANVRSNAIELELDGNESSSSEDENDIRNDKKRRRLTSLLDILQHKAGSLGGAVYGLGCGLVKKQMNSIYRFSGWQRTRYRLSLVYTSILLLSLTVLFSKRMLRGLGVDPKIAAPEFCSAEEAGAPDRFANRAPSASSAKSTLENIFAEETNLVQAKRQLEYSSRFLDALQSDIELYGEIEYACPMEPRTKAELRLDTIDRKGVDNETEPFFPAHCTAALELEMKRTREIKCSRRICVDTTVEVEQIDIDLEGIGGVWSWIREGEDGVVSTKTVEHEARGCKMVNVPCPDHDKLEELDAKTRHYLVDQTIRNEKLVSRELPTIVVEEEDTKMNEGLAKVMKKGGEVVDTLVQQIDVASSAFVLYLWISLFFPSPLYIFRSRLNVSFKRYIFGAKKALFIMLVLAVWWGVEYFQRFSIVLEVQLYFESLLQNPCFADITFLTNAAKSLNSVCREVVQVNHEWRFKTDNIASTLEEIDAFKGTCSCNYPCESLCGLYMDGGPTAGNGFGFGTSVTDMCGSCEAEVMLLNKDSVFVGNNTLCSDGSYAFSQVFASYSKMAASAGISWWSLWVSSGLLAAMLVKTFTANFAVSILRLADPMTYCGGQFEGPPTSQGFSASETLRTRCENNLKMIGLRKCIIWGFLSNVCLINMVTSSFHTRDDTSDMPKSNGGYILLGLSLVPPIYAWLSMRMSAKKIQSLNKDVESDEESPTIGSDLQLEEESIDK